jgi:hypothetical protein
VESVNEQDNETEQIGEVECVEETVLERVECVNVQDLNVQVEDNRSGLSDSHPELNGNDSEMDAHQQIDKVVRFVVTVDIHREDAKRMTNLNR